MPTSARMGIPDERGSALLVSLMVMGVLGLLGTALVFVSISDRHVSGYERDSSEALAAAETGIAYALRDIQDLAVTMEDVDGDGRPDFTMADSLDWGGSFSLVAEAGEIRGVGISAYRAEGFTIVCEGRAAGAVRRIKVEIIKDSFLKFARFVATTGTGYGCRDDITGELYVGGNLNISSCAAGEEVRFLEHVSVTGNVTNPQDAIFLRGYTEDAPEIDIVNSVDFDEMRDVAMGVASRSDCENRGGIGLFEDLNGGWDPIGISTTDDVLDLSRFDFYDTITSPGDTLIRYNGGLVTNTLTGQPLRLDEFNGVIFFDRDARVKGKMNGVSARSLTVFADRDVYADSSITMGTTGFDPMTRLPNGTGNPVNIGLVGHDYVYLGDVPQIVTVEAAVMAVRRNWRARNPSMNAHPPLLTGPVDLDVDGILGESPVNHDPDPGTGWDEFNLTTDHWVLNFSGPLITYDGASAVPWDSGSVQGAASGITWRYRYDLDVMEFPPPCFPDPLNLWIQESWTEIFDGEGTLMDFLPA